VCPFPLPCFPGLFFRGNVGVLRLLQTRVFNLRYVTSFFLNRHFLPSLFFDPTGTGLDGRSVLLDPLWVTLSTQIRGFRLLHFYIFSPCMSSPQERFLFAFRFGRRGTPYFPTGGKLERPWFVDVEVWGFFHQRPFSPGSPGQITPITRFPWLAQFFLQKGFGLFFSSALFFF